LEFYRVPVIAAITGKFHSSLSTKACGMKINSHNIDIEEEEENT